METSCSHYEYWPIIRATAFGQRLIRDFAQEAVADGIPVQVRWHEETDVLLWVLKSKHGDQPATVVQWFWISNIAGYNNGNWSSDADDALNPTSLLELVLSKQLQSVGMPLQVWLTGYPIKPC